MRLALVLAVVALITGCVRAEFTPHSRMSVKPRVCSRALGIYPGDLDYLAAAGAEVVGTVYVEGPREGAAVQTARAMATNRGGTHYLLEAADVRVEQYQVAPGTSTTVLQRQPNYGYGQPTYVAHTTYQEPEYGQIRVHQRQYLVLRVDPSRWGHLPPQLQCRR